MDAELDHVAIAVPSIAAALPFFESLTGGPGSPIERVADQGVAVAFVGSGPVRLELIEPLGPDTSVARFLERRGPGLHHVAWRVADVQAALDAWIARGHTPIDARPRRGAHGRLIAFLHPRDAQGVLVELVQATPVSPGP